MLKQAFLMHQVCLLNASLPGSEEAVLLGHIAEAQRTEWVQFLVKGIGGGVKILFKDCPDQWRPKLFGGK